MAHQNSTCLSGGAEVPLMTTNDCLPGFYCPNNTNSHPPVYCPPTPECQILRLARFTCEPQGIYEPVVCEEGYYCPPGGKQKLLCPSGSYCPRGSYKPADCSSSAICPAGAVKRIDIIGLSIVIVLDAFLLAGTMGVTAWKRWRTGRAMSQREEKRKADRDSAVTETYVESVEMEDAAKREEQIEDTQEDISGDLQRLVESMKKSVGEDHFGLSFDFRDLGLTIKGGRKLLAGVNGSIEAGSMWGVMGPSGAGKTTFMSVLMGKLTKTSGDLFVNGMKKDIQEYRRIIGYVPQDDIMIPELTVRENILHSARCRLPSSWSEEEICSHVDTVISCLSLRHVQHSLVGNAVHPVLSGGQRKRVNIGVELAAAPLVLFADEPTSGLDSTSALSVVRLLHAISRLGVTVVSVIHQPRSEIYECLDNILLISQGRSIYQGSQAAMQQYLEEDGFIFPPTSNPADIVMDIISSRGHTHRAFPRENEVDHLIARWEAAQPSHPPIRNIEDSTALDATVKARGGKWTAQMVLCFVRSMIQQRRVISSFVLELFVGGIAGGLIGLAVKHYHGNLFQAIYHPPFQLLSSAVNFLLIPEIGLIAGLAIVLAGSPSGVKVFGDEKLVYWREAASGHSRSAYYVGKVLSTIPRIALSSLHFTVFFTLLATPMMAFSQAYVTIMLNFYCIYGLASVVSMVVRKEDGALLSVVVGMIVATFCGYGPSLRTAIDWKLDWWWRMCPGTWFAEAWVDRNLEPLRHVYDVDQMREVMGYRLGWFSADCAALFVIGLVYRVIAFAGLVGVDRAKQR